MTEPLATIIDKYPDPSDPECERCHGYHELCSFCGEPQHPTQPQYRMCNHNQLPNDPCYDCHYHEAQAIIDALEPEAVSDSNYYAPPESR